MARRAMLCTTIIAALFGAGCPANVDAPASSSGASAIRLELTATGDGLLEYRLTNETAETVRVARWRTPLARTPDRFLDVSRDGEPVRYIGPVVTRLAPRADSYVVLEPGQSLSAEYDLRRDYDVSAGGSFVVRSALSASTVVLDADHLNVDFSASELVDVSATSKLDTQGGVAVSSSELVLNCNDAQWNTLAWAALGASYGLQNAISTHVPGSAKSNFYFGQGHDANTMTNVLYGMWATLNNSNGNWTCMGATGHCAEPDVIAYVNGSDVGTGVSNIQFCDPFFDPTALPGDDDFNASTSGALLHELAHLAGAPFDWYYWPSVEWLAQNIPLYAVLNADNYRYYVVNTKNQ